MQKSCNILSFDFNSTQVKVLEEHFKFANAFTFSFSDVSLCFSALQWIGVLVVFGFFKFSLQLDVE